MHTPPRRPRCHHRPRTPAALLLATLLFAAPRPASAQVQMGHYAPGFAGGLRMGMVSPDSGFTLANTLYVFDARKMKDVSGNPIPDYTGLAYVLNEIALLYRPPIKLAGATLQFTATVSIGNLASSMPTVVPPGGQTPAVGLSDIYFSPLQLGWQLGDFHISPSVGIFAPTGSYDPAGDGTGTGFWTFMPYLAATYHPRDFFPLLITAILRYEFHTNQRGHDFVPGQTLTFEWGVGAELCDGLDFGVVGYVYQQTTNPTGNDATNVGKYRAFGIGPALAVNIGPFDFGVRGYWDFEVRNSPEGSAFFIDLSYECCQWNKKKSPQPAQEQDKKEK